MKKFTLQMPDICGFEAQYYFTHKPDIVQAREFPTHMHDTLEIYVLLEGDASFIVEKSLYRLQPGDAIITKPNEIHNCVLNTASAHKHLCFWFSPASSFLLEEFTRHDFGERNLVSPSREDKKALDALYEKLHDATQKGDDRRKFYVLLEILDILSKNLRAHVAPQSIPDELKTILEDINTNFLHIKSLCYFTEKFFVSQSTLNRLFRTHLNTTPRAYLEAKRLAHARLLLKSGKSVLAAAMESGFPDTSNFIRLFKKRFSITPGQYRNS